jgi:hypothetical protein
MPLYFGVAPGERTLVSMMPMRLNLVAAPAGLEGVCADVKVGGINRLKSTVKTVRNRLVFMRHPLPASTVA